MTKKKSHRVISNGGPKRWDLHSQKSRKESRICFDSDSLYGLNYIVILLSLLLLILGNLSLLEAEQDNLQNFGLDSGRATYDENLSFCF